MRDRVIYIVIAILLLPALLINLGLPVLIDDEGIRMLVAMEMIWQDQYIAPTLHGAWYYNKPPLFNWIMAGFFALARNQQEFTGRLPTIVALLGYCSTIVWVWSRYFDLRTGLIVAGMFLTCGRVLFWDSMLGLIDMTFSWTMFGLFMVIYYQFERKRYWAMYGLSYLLMVVGFMLKGMPAIVFQGLTLLAWLSYRGAWKKLFHPAHFVCGLGALALLSMYYIPYGDYVDLEYVFRNLFLESSKRTAIQYGWEATLLHLFTFPLEQVYHFLPWTLLLVFGLHPRAWSRIKENSFLTFCSICALANVLPYWSSVEVYPRYLLMLAPLIFGIGLYLIEYDLKRQIYSWLQLFFGFLIGITGVLSLLPIVLERTQGVPGQYWMSFLLFGMLVTLTSLYFFWKKQRWLILIAALLVVRIALNWFALPDRLAHDTWGRPARVTSLHVGERYKDKPLYVFGEKTIMQPTNSYYLSRAYGNVIPRRDSLPKSGAWHIYDPEMYPNFPGTIEDSVLVRHGRRYYYVSRAK